MKIVIHGKPIAKKRPRFARRGKFVQTYSDQETEEGLAYLEAKQQINIPPMEGPLKLTAIFYMPRPKSHYGTGRNADKLKPSASRYPTVKPDLDNLLKFYCDVLNGLAWNDDSQVVIKIGEKRYSGNSEGRTEICIDAMDDRQTTDRSVFTGFMGE